MRIFKKVKAWFINWMTLILGCLHSVTLISWSKCYTDLKMNEGNWVYIPCNWLKNVPGIQPWLWSLSPAFDVIMNLIQADSHLDYIDWPMGKLKNYNWPNMNINSLPAFQWPCSECVMTLQCLWWPCCDPAVTYLCSVDADVTWFKCVRGQF